MTTIATPKEQKPIKALVIDDCRTMRIPYRDITHVRTNAEAIELLWAQEWDEVWFDYDLGGVYGKLETEYASTVMPTVDAILANIVLGNPPIFTRAFIHTMNPVGRRTLQTALENYYSCVNVDAALFTESIECQ